MEKKVVMNTEEFYTFKELASEANVKFRCNVFRGTVTVHANKQALENWGY